MATKPAKVTSYPQGESSAMATSLLKVAIFLAIITLVVARPRADTECGDCAEGVPDVPIEVPVTPPPTDECATGSEDVPPSIPDFITDPPLC